MPHQVTFYEFLTSLLLHIFWIVGGALCFWLSFGVESGGKSDNKVSKAGMRAQGEPTPFRLFFGGTLKKCLFLIILFGIPYLALQDLSGMPDFQFFKTVSQGVFNILLAVYLVPIPFIFWMPRSASKTDKSRLAWVRERLQKILNKGQEGEEITHSALCAPALIRVLGSDHYLFEDQGTLLLKAASKDQTTQEIDHLLLTSFGVFIIETKYWGGRLDIEEDGRIYCQAHDDEPYKKNPLIQSENKVKRISEHLNGSAPVNALAVFSSDDTILGHGDWSNMVLVSDLAGWFSTTKSKYINSGKPTLDVAAIRNALSDLIYAESDAKHIHLLKIQEPEYVALLSEAKRLEQSSRKKLWLWNKKSVNLFVIAEIALLILVAITAKSFPSFVSKIFPPQAKITKLITSEIRRPDPQLQVKGGSGSNQLSERPKSAPLWIPPPPPPTAVGWTTPEQNARSQSNATAVNGLINSASKCFAQRHYQCAYDKANEAYQLDSINQMAQAIMRNAINEQNAMISRSGGPK